MPPHSKCLYQHSRPLSRTRSWFSLFTSSPHISWSHLKSICLSQDMNAFPLEPSLLLSLFGSTEYSIIIFYLTANINSKWICTMLLFLSLGYITRDEILLVPSIFMQIMRAFFFEQLSNSPLCRCTTFSLSIIGWGISMLLIIIASFWLLLIKLW